MGKDEGVGAGLGLCSKLVGWCEWWACGLGFVCVLVGSIVMGALTTISFCLLFELPCRGGQQ